MANHIVSARNVVKRFGDITALFYSTKMPDRFFGNARQAMNAIESIKVSGIRGLVDQSSDAFRNPYSGRSNIKFTLIDDRVYIGGCSLNAQNHIDLMLGWNDAPLSMYLQNLADQMLDKGNVKKAVGGKDVMYKLGPGVSLLFDADVPGRSIIQQQAFKLIDKAQEHIYLTAQYFPTGKLSRRLLAAQLRGVEVTIIYQAYLWPQTFFLRRL